MDYEEYPAPAPLRRHVQCVWRLRDPDADDAVQTIYPDGRCELIAHFGAPMRRHRIDGRSELQAAELFAGQQRGPIRLQARGAVHCLGVRLMPAASNLIVGKALPAYRDEIADLRAIDDMFAVAFTEAAREFPQSQEPLWRLLASRCETHAFDPIAEPTVHALDQRDGDARITDLALAAHTSVRNLQTRFLAAVGLTPKEYARMRRLQALLQALDRRDAPIAQIVAGRGFADQAHATHDLRNLTGMTPARLVRAFAEDRDSETSVQLAAAFVRGRALSRR